MLIVGINKVSAGVICKYSEFEFDFKEVIEGKFPRVDWDMKRDGIVVVGNDIHLSDGSTKLIKNNDVALCPKKMYIYEFDYDGDIEYEASPKENVYEEYPPVHVYTRDLTDAYCYNCEYSAPVEDKYVNYENNGTKSCGTVTKIPSIFPSLVSTAYTIIQIAVPIVLVILGMFDLIKAITAQKDDDIKKAQGLFFKRLISALLVFFVFTVVKLAMSFATKYSGNLVKCMDCFIRNNCK